jgi:phosphatidylserine decarboxylase
MSENHQPIQFYHRYRNRMETEKVEGESALRWLYETSTGGIALSAVARHAWFSALYGWTKRRPSTAKFVADYCKEYGIDTSEFLQDADTYPHFAAFFERRLKPTARPIAEGDDVLVFPADGRHLLIADITPEQTFYAKNQQWRLHEFLQDNALADRYVGGSMLISRLCPVDYHRFHFPCAGEVGEFRKIPGKLYSVNPFALRKDLSYLWRNYREVTQLKVADRNEEIAIVEIGATMVGKIHQTFRAGTYVEKGDEKGYFAIGGSCVITLFQKGKVIWDCDLLECGERGIEVYAKMGDQCARWADRTRE